ncbi:MAG: hypothetical protein ACR2OA_10020 [Rubripirellula sp.]
MNPFDARNAYRPKASDQTRSYYTRDSLATAAHGGKTIKLPFFTIKPATQGTKRS